MINFRNELKFIGKDKNLYDFIKDSMMMDLLQETKKLLRLYNIFPKKRLGQNFIVNDTLFKRMISYAFINKEDVVLDIGAGLGFLASFLAQKCKRVIAVEIDPTLIKILRKRIHSLSNVELIAGDILKSSIPYFNKIISIPPYAISSPLLFWLLEKKFDCAVLIFQKEFADRLIASIGKKDYGVLTVMTYFMAEVNLLDHVPNNMFYPSPKVDSIVLRLKSKKPPFSVKDQEIFLKLLRRLFTQRNKKLRNVLVSFLRKKGKKKKNAMKLADSFPFQNERVKELSPENFWYLANKIIQNKITDLFDL